MLNAKESIDIIEKAESIHDLLHNIKPLIMGTGSLCENLGKQIKTAPQDQKKEIGKQLSELRTAIESAINTKLNNLEEKEINIKLLTQKIDGSLPSRTTENGLLHPITSLT